MKAFFVASLLSVACQQVSAQVDAQNTTEFTPEQMVTLGLNNAMHHQSLLDNKQITKAQLNSIQGLNNNCYYLTTTLNSTQATQSKLIYQTYNRCNQKPNNEWYEFELKLTTPKSTNQKLKNQHPLWVFHSIKPITPSNGNKTLSVNPKNYPTPPIIYEPSVLYSFLLKSLLLKKPIPYLKTFLSPNFLSSLGSSKDFYHALDKQVFNQNKLNSPYCNAHILTKSYTEHRNSQLDYSLLPICGLDTGTFSQQVTLKKLRGTSGWVVDGIKSSCNKNCSANNNASKNNQTD